MQNKLQLLTRVERLKVYLEQLDALPESGRASFVAEVSVQDPGCAAELGSLARSLRTAGTPKKLRF